MYLFFFLLSFIFPMPAFAQEAIGGCDPDNELCKLGSSGNLEIGNIVSVIIQFVFVVAVILALGFLVYGGFRWLTSGGDKDAVASARGTIIGAIIGLILIVLSYFILNFVLLFLTGDGFDSISIPQIGVNSSSDVVNGNRIQDCIAAGGTPITDNNGTYLRCQ